MRTVPEPRKIAQMYRGTLGETDQVSSSLVASLLSWKDREWLEIHSRVYLLKKSHCHGPDEDHGTQRPIC
jgi:hypothetical protein